MAKMIDARTLRTLADLLSDDDQGEKDLVQTHTQKNPTLDDGTVARYVYGQNSPKTRARVRALRHHAA